MKTFYKTISYLSMGFLLVSILSGIILLFGYYPNEAYSSIVKLKEIDFGEFFRKLHYFSSELFLIAVLIHIVVELYRNSKDNLKKIAWQLGILALFALFILMFSGYVLKGDLNGISAAQVAYALIDRSIPVLLPIFKDDSEFLWRFFILHVVIFPTILIYSLYFHARFIFTKFFLPALAISILILLIIPMQEDINPLMISKEVSGPWFFLGGENLLILGINPRLVTLFLGVPFLILIALIYIKNLKWLKICYIMLTIWLVLYAIFSFI